MSVKEEIDLAIGAHGAWKQKLRIAIDTGICESTPDRVRCDNNCSFGKWLHQRIDSSAKTSSYYQEALLLHAQFHQEAGDILEKALNGQKEEALELIKLGSYFSKKSSELTKKLQDWQLAL